MKSFREWLHENRDHPSVMPRDVLHRQQPGIYSSHVSHGSGKKKVSDYHEVHASSHREAINTIAARHAEKHGLKPHEMSFAVSTQYHGAKKTPPSPPPKPPHRDSREQAARDEMQRRYDSQKGFKGE